MHRKILILSLMSGVLLVISFVARPLTRSLASSPAPLPPIAHSATLIIYERQPVNQNRWVITAENFKTAEYVNPAGVSHTGPTASLTVTCADQGIAGVPLAAFPGRLATVGGSTIAVLEVSRDTQGRNYIEISIEP